MFARKLERIVSLLSRLPGVGEKTAQRYVLFLVTADESLSRELGAELARLHDVLRPCVRCGNIAEIEQPGDDARLRHLQRTTSATLIFSASSRACTTSWPSSARARCAGAISSSESSCRRSKGSGPRTCRSRGSIDRVRSDAVSEVIVATPPSVDGEATALLLKRELAPLGVTLSRIASGVPHGGDLEFADPITMGRALSGRQRLLREETSMKEPISTKGAPAAIGPYSQAIRAGGLRLPERADSARSGLRADDRWRHRRPDRARHEEPRRRPRGGRMYVRRCRPDDHLSRRASPIFRS